VTTCAAHFWDKHGGYRVPDSPDVTAQFTGKDEGRKHVRVRLTPVVSGVSEPTDVQFPPGKTSPMVVLEKKGRALWFDLAGRSGTLLEVKVSQLLRKAFSDSSFTRISRITANFI
jgi:hypothetical protein